MEKTFTLKDLIEIGSYLYDTGYGFGYIEHARGGDMCPDRRIFSKLLVKSLDAANVMSMDEIEESLGHIGKFSDFGKKVRAGSGYTLEKVAAIATEEDKELFRQLFDKDFDEAVQELLIKEKRERQVN